MVVRGKQGLKLRKNGPTTRSTRSVHRKGQNLGGKKKKNLPADDRKKSKTKRGPGLLQQGGPGSDILPGKALFWLQRPQSTREKEK